MRKVRKRGIGRTPLTERLRKRLRYGDSLPDVVVDREIARVLSVLNFREFMETGAKTDRRTRRVRRQAGVPVEQPVGRLPRLRSQWVRS